MPASIIDTTGSRRLARVTKTLGVIRDCLIVLVGVGVLISTPPSVEEYGNGGVAFAAMWSLLPLFGGIICIVGLFAHRPAWEVVGAFTIASGFVVWTVTIVASVPSLVGLSIAGAFLSMALSAVLRGLVVATGLLPISREA